MTVEEYIKKGKTLNYSAKWAKELERASVRYRVTRLEALKLQMQQQVEALTGYEVDGLDKLARDIYEDGYYRAAFEIQKGYGVGSSFMRLDTRAIDKIISAPYTADGLNFSERIWGKHRPELLQKLNTELVQSIIRGEDPQKLINSIAKQFGVSKKQAGSLVMTESAFFASASTRDSYKELGVEKFEVLATLDGCTCESCGRSEGKPIPMSEYEIGTTAPPFHPNCRCTTTPYLEDEEPSHRAARDANGNYIEVPANMTYKEWQKKFLKAKPAKPVKPRKPVELVDVVAPGESVELTEPAADKNVSFLKRITDYDVSTLTNREKLARQVLDELGLEDIPVHMEKMQANGYCKTTAYDLTSHVSTYALDSGDVRDDVYKIKTIFHEAFHANSHGRKNDITIIGSKAWSDIEEIFAETSSHYLTKQAGFDEMLAPSYADKFIKLMPRLKRLDEYKGFNSIMDFGKWGWTYRMTDKGAAWGDLYARAMKIKFNWKKYVADNYIEYIDQNLDELLEKMLEAMPQYSKYKSNMRAEYLSAKDKLKTNNRLSGNEEMVISNLAANAMMRIGVK